MFKLVIFLFAVFAAQATSTDNAWQRQLNYVQDMATKIREISNDITDSIQNIDADSDQGKLTLLEQSNEFAHNVHSVVFEMQQTAFDTEGEDKKVLQQIAQQLNEFTYSVQQAMNSEANQTRDELKEQIEKVVTEAEKLSQHIQQTQKPQGDENDHTKEMKRIMMDLFGIFKKLKTQTENKDKHIHEIYNRFHEIASHMRNYIQDVQSDDQQAVEDLIDFVQRISQKVNDMIDRFQRETNDQEGQVKHIMQYVASKMSEIRRDLEKAVHTEGNTQQKANTIKDQLNRTILNLAAELQRLLQIVQQSNDQGKITIKHVILDSVAIAETIQTQLKMLKKN
ncbi:hypothetical protein ILUMI_18925 [Ignelater luminosus]|uniref:Uncharacterized protein n=1 Tax=Ignelater luminosus TaxID=2038154 RepID=A0A8K0CL57_IGNLU|nr:hypothetical protein ILUMI_18925 [Ignelater luminosus]